MKLKDGDLVIYDGEVKVADWVREYTVVVKGWDGLMVVPLDRVKLYENQQPGGGRHGYA